MKQNFFFRMLILLFFVGTFSFQAYSYQLFSTEKRVPTSYKNFKYFISSTYYNYTADDQLPITEIHIEGIKKSLEILTSKAATVGVSLTFEYGGTFDYETDKLRNASSEANDAFDKAIYYDFTSNELWGRKSIPSALASSKKSAASGANASGGVVRFNSDFINFLHPKGNLARFVIHETMHVLGVDHSTVSSANMAYTEFWYATLSADDLFALQNLYGVGPSTSLSFTVTLNGQIAKGVEVVAINSDTGVSYVGMTNQSGVLTMNHLPHGTYMLASRELTPTGPCFESPTRGFLTSFYVSSGVATNDPAQAARVTLSSGSNYSINLSLIVGKKKFDCHFGLATALSDEACNSLVGASSWSYNEKCFMHMTTNNVRYPMLENNDKSIFNHQTDTDLASGVHASVTHQNVGSQQGLTFHSTEPFSTEFGNMTKIDLEVSSSAATGVQAALCKGGGEYALMSSFIEVQDFGGTMTTERLLPTMADAFYEHSLLPPNFSAYLRDGDITSPGSGPRPPNKVVPPPASSEDGGSSSKKKRKWYEFCGALIANNSKSSQAASVLLFAPLVFILFIRRKTIRG